MEGDRDNNQVMDMLQVISNNFFRVLRVPGMNYKVSRGSNRNFVRNVPRQVELTFVPTNINLMLLTIGQGQIPRLKKRTRFPRIYRS